MSPAAGRGEGLGVTEEEFLSKYEPTTPVSINGETEMRGKPLTLGFVLAAEAGVCPADPEKRSDPSVRIARLAMMLHEAGSLHEDHLSLLPPSAEED